MTIARETEPHVRAAFLKTSAQGAQTSIYLASSPDVAGVTGQFFEGRKPRAANKVAYNTDLAARLRQVSADLVGMTTLSSAAIASMQ